MFDLLEAMKNSKQQPIVIKQKPAQIIELEPFLNRCCSGLNAGSKEVKANLLNAGNIKDILNGDIPARCIRSHIELWIVEGKQSYIGTKK